MEYFPCQNQDNCPERVCREDVHHVFYPKRDYRTATEQAFRELDANKELTCRDRHNEIHATQPIPEKPSIREMQEALGWLAREGVA